MATPARHHRAPRQRNVPLIVGLVVGAVLLVAFGAFALVASMKSGTPASNPVAAPTTARSTTPSPRPTGIDPTDLGTTKATPTASSSSTSTPTFQPKPLNFGNGSGCDTGTNFAARLEAPVSGANATFKGTACLKKGESIWAFNFNMENSLYFLVSGKADKPAPIVSSSGVWNWTDKKVDSNTVVNFIFANQTCSDWIAGQDPNSDFANQIVLNNIQQHGCQVASYLQVGTPSGN